MQIHKFSQKPETDARDRQIEGVLWLVLIILLFSVISILVHRNWEKISSVYSQSNIDNFDEVIVKDNFHDISLENGQSWDISYETGRMRSFIGLVRHVSSINEPAFAILTHDILVTNGDYANPDLVQASVSNHHFTWSAPTLTAPQGTIHLLHTVPINEDINEQLQSIQNGDSVIVSGYDIYRIEGFDSEGKYIGFWEDSGCNTTLVTSVKIVKSSRDQ